MRLIVSVIVKILPAREPGYEFFRGGGVLQMFLEGLRCFLGGGGGHGFFRWLRFFRTGVGLFPLGWVF